MRASSVQEAWFEMVEMSRLPYLRIESTVLKCHCLLDA